MSDTQNKNGIKAARKVKFSWLNAVPVIAFVLFYVIACYVLPLPKVYLQTNLAQPTAEATAALKWPKKGQSAIGALGYGVLDTTGGDKPMPIASVAKVLTALAVLKQKPLLKDQQGPVITINDDDVATYQKYADSNGSLVAVQVGEQLSEYQALQALLLPSANNIADLLVKWAFGSETKYVSFSNSFVKSLGLDHTTIDDASGFSPKTVSTARDLVLLGENAMDNPVLAEIVGQSQANIPVAGVINNVNSLLGHNEIIGIKTGNTDEAGGCYLFAAKHTVEQGYDVTIIGVTIGAPDLSTAIDSSLALLKSTYANFDITKSVARGDIVGRYVSPWGSTANVSAVSDIEGISWKALPPKVLLDLKPFDPKNSRPEGEVSVLFGRKKVRSSLILVKTLTPASIMWRLTHPLQLIQGFVTQRKM